MDTKKSNFQTKTFKEKTWFIYLKNSIIVHIHFKSNHMQVSLKLINKGRFPDQGNVRHHHYKPTETGLDPISLYALLRLLF